MLKIYGYNTQNNKKVLYVAQELNIPYKFITVDLLQRENRTDDFLKMNPTGKVPVIEHNENFLFESNAICRYLADISDTPLLPRDNFKKAQVDQWMEFFTNHLGKSLNTLYFEKVFKRDHNISGINQPACLEAEKFCAIQLKILEKELSKRDFIALDELSIADLCAYAYIEQMDLLEMSYDSFPNILKWKKKISTRDCIAEVKKQFNNKI